MFEVPRVFKDGPPRLVQLIFARSGLLSYTVWITNPGVYTFQMHNFHSDPDGSEGNDIFVRMANEQTTQGKGWDKAFSNKVGVWMWDTLFHHPDEEPEYGLIQWDLAAGAHTLQISGRSHEMAIDRIHLHTWHALSKSVCAPLSQRQGYPAPVNPECTLVNYVDGPAGEDGYVRVPNWDFFGSDMWPSVQYNVATIDACLDHCSATEGCIGFTWHAWGGCFPKNGLGSRKQQFGAISAYLEEHRPSPQNPNAPTEPTNPTEPSPTPPPTNPAPTNPGVVEYTYEEDFGRGCCRTTGGVRENEIYIHHIEIKDFATCVNLCSDEPACNGFELTGHEGCELHTSPITHIVENENCQCHIRHGHVAAPTEPAPTPPAPTPPSPTEPSPTPPPTNPETEVVALLTGNFGYLATYPDTGTEAREVILAQATMSVFLRPDGVHTAEAHIIGTGFPASSDGNAALSAHLHVEPCAMSGGAHYQDPSCSPNCAVNAANELWPMVTVTPDGAGSGQATTAWAPPQSASGHLSVVIHDSAGTKMLCADLAVTGTGTGGSGSGDDDSSMGRSCQVQPGFDLWGNDIPGGMNTGAADVSECAGHCLDHLECTHFTFIWNGCYLKSSGMGKKANKNGISGWCTDQVDDFLDEANGPRGEHCMNGGAVVDTIPFDQEFTCDCSETIYIGANCEELANTDHGCAVETNVDLYGNDIPGHGHIPVGSGEECAALCANFDQCIAFTMVWGHCYMKSSANGRTSVGFPATSGTCRGPIETTTAPVGQTKTCGQNLPGINLDGHDIPGGAHKVTGDEFGCATMCEANPSCGFFTFIWGHCYLKNSDAGSETKSQGKSGACITTTDSGEPTDPPTNPPVITDPPTDPPVVTDPPTDPPVVTDPPTDPPSAPPTNPTPAGGGVTFAYAEDFGSGYCRTTDGVRANEIYIWHPEVEDSATCADLCSAVGECNGFELTPHDGCELHTSPITHIRTSNQGQCFIKHTLTAPAVDDDAAVAA